MKHAAVPMVALWAVLVSAAGALSSEETPVLSPHIKQHLYAATDCGPVCLAVVCRLRHVDAPLSKIREMSQHSARGTNAVQLMEAARKLGLGTVGIKCTAATLAERNCLAIVGLKDHFAVFVGVDRRTGKLLMVDVPRPPYLMTVAELQEQWGNGQGNALLFPPPVPPSPASTVRSPVIAVEPSSRYVGEIWQGDSAAYQFTVRNIAGRGVRINEVRTCCGTTAALSKKDLAPGETAALEVTYQDTTRTSQPSMFSKTVLLIPSEGVDSCAGVRLQGVSKPRYVVEPSRLPITVTTQMDL